MSLVTTLAVVALFNTYSAYQRLETVLETSTRLAGKENSSTDCLTRVQCLECLITATTSS